MTATETVLGWLGGAGRWLYANRAEVASLLSTSFGLGLYVMWNYAQRPPPLDPFEYEKWRRREKFAFAVWNKSGLVPKWMVETMPWPDPDGRPPGPTLPPGAPKA